MKRLRLIFPLLLCLCLCACGSQLDKEYSSISPHVEQYEVDQYSDALTVENYLGLKNAILNFVETGTSYGVVRIYQYDGSLISDLANAAYEVSHTDPLGAYAVDYMTYDYAHIVSYYELYFYITFRVSIDRIDAVTYCSDVRDIEDMLETALLERSMYQAIRIPNFQDFDPTAILHQCFLAHPELGISEPEYAYTFYPDTGIQRILELVIKYPYDALSMQVRQASLEETAAQISTVLNSYSNDAIRLERLYQWILNNVKYMGEESYLFSSAYNALVNEYGSSLGISMAVQLLCQQCDLPCFLVEGYLDGSPWYWNIVYADGKWQHFDAAAGILSESEEQRNYIPLYDEDMTAYAWDTTLYPACPTPEPAVPADMDAPLRNDVTNS